MDENLTSTPQNPSPSSQPPSSTPDYCALCGTTESTPVVQIGECAIYECNICHLQRTYPPLNAQQTADLYGKTDYYDQETGQRFQLGFAESVMQYFRNWRVRDVLKQIKHPVGKRVLDVGCGKGHLLSSLKAKGCEVYGTQLSEPAARYAREKLGLQNVFVGQLQDALYPDDHFDHIVFYHVFEHLSDPKAYLAELYRILKPTGTLYIEVPNADSVGAESFGKHWLAYDVPKHRWHFEPKTLSKMMEVEGFSGELTKKFSLEYTPATFLFSAVSYLFNDNNSLFYHLTGERQSSQGKIFLHAFTAGLILPFAFLISWLGSLQGRGDTIGMTFRKVSKDV